MLRSRNVSHLETDLIVSSCKAQISSIRKKIKLQQNVHATRKTALNLIENRHNPEKNNAFDNETKIILAMQR